MDYLENSRRQLAALREKERVRILAIETSCDETAAAVVEDGRKILSNAVFTQIDLHALYGGVVPEIASRAHVEKVDRMVDAALRQADMTLAQVDAIAVTYVPGLVGAQLIGVSCAKALAYAAGKPLIPVNHIEGHISANFLTHPDFAPPFACLVVSGGHSHLFSAEDYGVYRIIGQTQDDAAGEAFDKAARVLNIPYPGGPLLDKLAEEGDPHALKLPRPHTEGRYDYSLSGLKTAFINAVHNARQKGEALNDADLAASFRQAVVSMLVDKAILAAQELRLPQMALAGGVSANRLLRREMEAACRRIGVPLYMPQLSLCGDNAAMIGSAAYYRLLRGEIAGLELNGRPALRL